MNHYKVIGPSGSVEIELCDEDAEPLLRFLNPSAGVSRRVKHTSSPRRQASTPSAGAKRGTGKFKVMSLEEIEELKRQEAAAAQN